jgi:hypothetical protein
LRNAIPRGWGDYLNLQASARAAGGYLRAQPRDAAVVGRIVGRKQQQVCHGKRFLLESEANNGKVNAHPPDAPLAASCGGVAAAMS